MPDSSDNYQLPSWPPTKINRDIWNVVMASIGSRLTAREALEADFEALIAQGTQASLDYIQATVAPQIASLQTSIELAQEQIDQIVVDGIAPNAAKLGGQLPAYYATAASVTAVNTAVGLRATTVYVDAELLELATAVQAVLDQKANQSVSISATGLASGGGNLSANRTITVPKATDAESQARTRDDVAATPRGMGLALAAYNRWETIEEVSLSAATAYIRTNLSAFYSLVLDGSLITSVATTINMSVSADNGATFIATGDHIAQASGLAGPTPGDGQLNNLGALPISWTTIRANDDLTFFFTFHAFNKNRRGRLVGYVSGIDNTPSGFMYDLSSFTPATTAGQTARNAFRLLPTAGTITGQFTLSGKRG